MTGHVNAADMAILIPIIVSSIASAAVLIIREIRSAKSEVKVNVDSARSEVQTVKQSVGTGNGDSLVTLVKKLEAHMEYDHKRNHELRNCLTRIEAAVAPVKKAAPTKPAPRKRR